MKGLWVLFLCLFLGTIVCAQSKNFEQTSFEVGGNCGMCKKNIEKAIKIKGVKKANWDVNTKLLNLYYNPSLISLDQIQLRIAAAGYDTPKYRANDETYNALHECCHYPRK
ncbi:MAG: heavy-metal-associated domain-containing protein [Saprospiraceae bacterium]|nr:heavy-metal-associated domain-containing protein [Saprospiraceae bacterium]